MRNKIKKKRKPLPQKVRDAASKALQGNAFWQQRSKHGRDLLFGSPQLLWEAACEYFTWCDLNPHMRAENKVVSNGGGSGSSVELHSEPVKRVYTMHGLCLYLNCNTAYFSQFKTNKIYKENKDFPKVIADIEGVVFNQQFDGAATGFFNANIISRALGLIDRVDQTSGGEVIQAPVVQIEIGRAS